MALDDEPDDFPPGGFGGGVVARYRRMMKERRMKLRIYIAGTGHDPRFATTMIADNLRAHDFDVVSRWHNPGVWKPGNEVSIKDEIETAARNYADIDKADVVLVVVPAQEHHLRGAHTECGYALAKGKKIAVWGAPRSLNTMVPFDKALYEPDWRGVVALLQKLHFELTH